MDLGEGEVYCRLQMHFCPSVAPVALLDNAFYTDKIILSCRHVDGGRTHALTCPRSRLDSCMRSILCAGKEVLLGGLLVSAADVQASVAELLPVCCVTPESAASVHV